MSNEKSDRQSDQASAIEDAEALNDSELDGVAGGLAGLKGMTGLGGGPAGMHGGQAKPLNLDTLRKLSSGGTTAPEPSYESAYEQVKLSGPNDPFNV